MITPLKILDSISNLFYIAHKLVAHDEATIGLLVTPVHMEFTAR